MSVDAAIAVVPMDHVESYYEHEIAREGAWRSDVSLIVIHPRTESGRAGSDWFPRVLAQMRQVREQQGTLPLRLPGGLAVDVGLIDIQVFFRAAADQLARISDADPERVVQENLGHVDAVCAGALHDQMVVALASHAYRTDGTPLIHFHNLVFGLRKEVRDGQEMIGPLDLEPLLKVLGTGRKLAFIPGTSPLGAGGAQTPH